MKTVGIFTFPGMLAQDAIGPLEVFAVARDGRGAPFFRVFTFSHEPTPLRCANGPTLTPDHGRADCPRMDVLVIPGGAGVRAAAKSPETVAWIKALVTQAELTLSVCTGALLLARTGVLDGQRATTHHRAYGELREVGEGRVTVVEGVPLVESGALITTAGVLTGVGGALHVVAKLCGQDAARRAAHHLEHPWDEAAR